MNQAVVTMSSHTSGQREKANPQIYYVRPIELYEFVIVVHYWPTMKVSH